MHITGLTRENLIPERLEQLSTTYAFDFCPLCNATLHAECHRGEKMEQEFRTGDENPQKFGVCSVCRIVWILEFAARWRRGGKESHHLWLRAYSDCWHGTPVLAEKLLLGKWPGQWEWKEVFPERYR